MTRQADDPTTAEPPEPEETGARRRLLDRILSREELAHQLSQQWAQLRAAQRHEEPVRIETGPTNFRPAQVPFGVDLAAAWAWRFLVIVAAGYLILWVLAYFRVVMLPLAISLLIAAAAAPAVGLMRRAGLPRKLASAIMVVGGLAVIVALLSFVGQQVVQGVQDLADQVVQGLEQIRTWLKDGPLNASDSQINDYIAQIEAGIADFARETELRQVTEFGTAIGHVVAGFFIVLFATYFFLADGERIWAWAVRLFPRAARARVDESGQVAWISLTQFVKATVVVAFADAVGIVLWAYFLGLPLVAAIGVLVFLGAFIPMVGATIAGSVAVLVALVSQGPITALLMLVGVIMVQQIEGHVLQPFLMGRFVSLHPLGVIVAIGCGVLVAGIAGALIAVPLASAVNAVVQHLAAHTHPGADPQQALAEDHQRAGKDPDVDPETYSTPEPPEPSGEDDAAEPRESRADPR